MRSLVVPTLLGAVLSGAMPVSAQGADLIFQNGFEACCTVGGMVSGLAGSGLVLRLNAGAVTEDRPIFGNGAWNFTTPLGPGIGWSVHVQNQPASGPQCQVTNASGTMGATPVTNIAVHCGGFLQWDAGNWGELWQ